MRMTSAENEQHDQFLRLYVEHEGGADCLIVRTLVPSRDDARDVMQEVAVLLWRKFGELAQPADFRPWAFTVARFKALAWVRGRQRDRLVFDDDVLALLADEVADHADAYEAERKALETRVQKLAPAQRKLLDAACAPGACMDALAAEAGRTPMSFYKALHRIRLALLDCTQRMICSRRRKQRAM